MKFLCDSCGTKYSIADDRVKGRVLKIRCKKCDFVITVREETTAAPLAEAIPQSGSESEAPPQPAQHLDESTMFGEPPPMATAPAPAPAPAPTATTAPAAPGAAVNTGGVVQSSDSTTQWIAGGAGLTGVVVAVFAIVLYRRQRQSA